MKEGKTPNGTRFEVHCQKESVELSSHGKGMVGNRSAFATAALVSTTTLAATLLVAPDAGAHGNHPHNCGWNDCFWPLKCCPTYDGGTWHYDCIPWNATCGC